MYDVIIAAVWFIIFGGVFGFLLAYAGRIFRVGADGRADSVSKALPGLNCGGCGYAGCAAYANAVVSKNEAISKCPVGGEESAGNIAAVLGVGGGEKPKRYRAQVMCSGTNDLAKKKYIYEGIADCAAVNRLAGGDKMCPSGCIGHGTCVKVCPFGAIQIINGVAAVSYDKCRACGMCVRACPKDIIKLVPYESQYWVGCMSSDNGTLTKAYCDVGCTGCRLCQRECPNGAIKSGRHNAVIDYDKCDGCGKCSEVCPRRIIWSGKKRREGSTISRQDLADHDD